MSRRRGRKIRWRLEQLTNGTSRAAAAACSDRGDAIAVGDVANGEVLTYAKLAESVNEFTGRLARDFAGSVTVTLKAQML